MLFADYQKLEHDEQLFMGNSAISTVEGKGKVILKCSFEKELTLNEVLHFPDICMNLFSGSILSKKGFRIVFESDKFVITKNRIRVILLMDFLRPILLLWTKSPCICIPNSSIKEIFLFICLNLLYCGMLD